MGVRVGVDGVSRASKTMKPYGHIFSLQLSIFFTSPCIPVHHHNKVCITAGFHGTLLALNTHIIFFVVRVQGNNVVYKERERSQIH